MEVQQPNLLLRDSSSSSSTITSSSSTITSSSSSASRRRSRSRGAAAATAGAGGGGFVEGGDDGEEAGFGVVVGPDADGTTIDARESRDFDLVCREGGRGGGRERTVSISLLLYVIAESCIDCSFRPSPPSASSPGSKAPNSRSSPTPPWASTVPLPPTTKPPPDARFS